MYFFKQKTKEEGKYNPFRKSPDIFWIIRTSGNTENVSYNIGDFQTISVVINREAKLQARYSCHYEIQGGSLSLFQELLPFFKVLDTFCPITPSKVRDLLIKYGVKEVQYNKNNK
jgi:hypothetical protein